MTDLPTTDTDSVDAPVATDEAADASAETTEDDGAAKPARPSLVERLEEEGDVAADYLEGLLDIADLDGDIDMDVEADRALVAIVGTGLDPLVGPTGKVLDALQELTRLAVQTQTGERTRLLLDVGGFRVARRAELTEVGQQAVERAKGGERVVLSPMTAFERKVVHDAVAAAGLSSESEGVEPGRRVVVLPPTS